MDRRPEEDGRSAAARESDELREAEIVRRLRRSAGPGGVVRFDRYMDVALYEPDVGFYTHPGVALGPEGAYYTAAHVTPLFGRALAHRIARAQRELGTAGRLRVVELGPGDGTLAADVIRELAALRTDRSDITYVLVDRSEALAARAERAASRAAGPLGVRVETASSLSASGVFEGVVVANEVLDALPCRRLRRGPDGWRELGVRIAGGSLEWAEMAYRGPADALPDAPIGNVLEWTPLAGALVREIADHLTSGTAVILDYGASEPEIVAGRPSGTLAAVRGHRPVADPLAHPGLVDLSAFVNFTRLRAAAERSGLREVAFRSQANALVEWGLEELARRAVEEAPEEESSVRTRLAVKNLLFGFENFRVLELAPPTA